MREMKDSGIAWIGVIPQDWEIVRTKSLYCSAKEIAGDRADDFERLALTLNGVIKRSKEDSVGLQPEKFSGYQILKKGELVFKLIDLENVATSRVGLSPYTGIVSPAYIVLSKQSRAKDLVVRYSMYHFLSMWQREIFNQMGDNGVRSSLNTKELLNIPHPFPSICEQKRIVTFLDAQCAEIDAVLEKTRASIEEYKKLKQVVITQAVTKGIRGDRPMKDSGIEWIGEIPAEWEIRKIFRVINKVGDIDHYMPDSVDDGIPYLMTGDLQEKLSDVNLKRCKKVSFQDYEMLSSKIRVSKGDVIFARYATIGTVCFVDTEDNILVSYACLIIKPNSSLLYGEFLFYYLKSTAFLEEIKQYIKANTQANVGLDSVSKAKIALPSVHEQQKIVEYLRDKCKKIDALIAKKQQYITEIENYKKSLIYEYVTGKKEVLPL
jgi:type I restriction enzyme S subunit